MADSETTIYNPNDSLRVKHLDAYAAKLDKRIAELNAQAEGAFRGAKVQGNNLNFYATSDTTQTPIFTVDLPAASYLSQIGTEVVADFEFDSDTYKGASDPNLDGKPVLVFAIESGEGTETSVNYSFVNMSAIVENAVVSVSSETGNAIISKPDGIFVDTDGKIDKVIGATAGNIAIFASDGSVVDSNVDFVTDKEFDALLNKYFPLTDNDAEGE